MGRRLINRQYKLGSRAPSMQTITGDSGIANLSPYITLNSQTVAPTFLYHGNDATATTWPAQWGETLAIAGTGTDPLLNQPAYGNGASDASIYTDSGKHYLASSTTFGDVATEDIVIEFIGTIEAGANVLLEKLATGVAGYTIYNVNDRLYIRVQDGTSSATASTAVLSYGQSYHCIIFIDRSGSAQWYINGSASGSAGPVSSIGSLTSATTFAILSDAPEANKYDGNVVYTAMWQQSAWLDTHLQAAVALERFQKWSGIYPTRASGTAAPTYSRACSAYATKWNGTSYDLINCSAGLPRVDYVLDDSSTPFKGMLIEPQGTNLLTYSEDSTELTVLDAGDVLGAAAGIAPNNQSTMVSLVADATDGQHGAAESNAPTLAAVSTTYSRYFIKGGNDHVWLENTTVANTQSWFNLDTGAVGTLGSGATSRISGPFYSDLGEVYRCEITFTGTVAAHTFNWGSSAVDNDETFAGDAAAINCYTWGAQVEAGTKATSYIYTAGASATRLADSLQYNGDNVTAGQGTIKAEMLVDAHTPAAELSIAALSDGGSTDEMVRSYVDAGTQVPIFNAVDSTVAQWTITGSTDVVDGDIHTVKLPYESNIAKQYVDNAVDGTPDTSCTVPTGIDEIDIGQDTASANQLNGRIRNFRIYSFASSDV